MALATNTLYTPRVPMVAPPAVAADRGSQMFLSAGATGTVLIPVTEGPVQAAILQGDTDDTAWLALTPDTPPAITAGTIMRDIAGRTYAVRDTYNTGTQVLLEAADQQPSSPSRGSRGLYLMPAAYLKAQ